MLMHTDFSLLLLFVWGVSAASLLFCFADKFHLINALLIPQLYQEYLSFFQFSDCFSGIIGKFIVLPYTANKYI